MGLVFVALFRQNLADFFPYLTAGMIIWNLISTTATESCMVFILNERLIKKSNLPLSIYAMRGVAKQILLLDGPVEEALAAYQQSVSPAS